MSRLSLKCVLWKQIELCTFTVFLPFIREKAKHDLKPSVSSGWEWTRKWSLVGKKRKTWETGSCSHQLLILPSQLPSAHHCPSPFSLSLSCFLFSSKALNRSFLSLLHFSSWFSLTPISASSLHPLPCPAKGLEAQMNGGQSRSQRASVIHSLCPSPLPPSSVLLLPSLRVAAAGIGALLRALRWRAYTVGLLRLS